MKTLPSVDVVIVGGGWTGLLMAKELGSRTALSVVVLERGGSRKTDDYGEDMDELDYSIRLRMMQNAAQETVTLRHNPGERALPLRQFASFLPGSGIGGAGEHWNGVFPRMLPDCFELFSQSTKKYGADRLPEDHSIQDWGVTYDDMEPYYTSKVGAARNTRRLPPRSPIFLPCFVTPQNPWDTIPIPFLLQPPARLIQTRMEYRAPVVPIVGSASGLDA